MVYGPVAGGLYGPSKGHRIYPIIYDDTQDDDDTDNEPCRYCNGTGNPDLIAHSAERMNKSVEPKSELHR